MRPFATLAKGEWPDGGPYPHVLVIPRSPEWTAFVNAHKPVLRPFVEDKRLGAVPSASTHLTIQGVFGSVTPADMDQITTTVRHAVSDLEPFDMQLGPAQVGRSGITVAVWPEGPIDKLYGRVRDGLEAVHGLPDLRPRADRFWPHISLAYGLTPFHSDDLIAEVRDLRPERVSVTVAEVAVVWEYQRPDLGYYTWDDHATIPLLGGGPH